jgi:transcriptional repressor NrdR
MRCPYCSHLDTAVKDSRVTDDDSVIRRRRFCQACGGRFTTFERIELRQLMILKKDGSTEPFDRTKLSQSIVMALRKRPFTQAQIEKMINGLVRQLETKGDAEISSQMIGTMILENLYHLDPVAYIRFASVYKEFSTIDDFSKMISAMKEEKSS